MTKEALKLEIEKLLGVLGTTVTDVSIEETRSSEWKVLIQTKNSDILIGENGTNFQAFNHLARKIFVKKFGEEQKISIDVNGYQNKAIEGLKKEVTEALAYARASKKDVDLRPMSSYERMQVHTTLAEHKDVKSESQGEGPSRHIIIKYIGG